MFGHYLKIAIRNIAKYKTQSIIVILSIALGMVFCSLTLMWIRYERSYDSLYSNCDDIYLVLSNNPAYVEKSYGSYVPYSDGTFLVEKYPQIEGVARCMRQDLNVFREGNAVQLNGQCVDDTYQDFFEVKVLEGDNILNLSKDEVALTKSQADKLFENGNAVGQTLYTNMGVVSVKSVIEDPKRPTSFPYDFLMGYDLEKYDTRGYITTNLFVRVSDENLDMLAREIETDTVIYNGSMTLSNGYEVTWQQTFEMKFKLLPLSKVRAEAEFYNAVEKNVNLQYVYILMLLGIVLIVCSLTNYFTLFVTKIRMRVREISLRYANGAGMKQIVMLFCTEILIVLLLSLLAGVVIFMFVLPFFKVLSVMDKSVTFFITSYIVSAAIIGLLSLLVAMAFIAVTGRKQLAQYFGSSVSNTGTAMGYKISIGFQLTVSLCAIFCSVIINRQLHHLLLSSDMGYTKHNVGFCYQYGMTETDVMAAKEKLKMMPELDKVVYGYRPAGTYSSYSSVDGDSVGGEPVNIKTAMIKANRDYLDIIEVKLVAGELFSQEEQGNAMVINETLANMLGGADKVVGKEIISLGTPYLVKGVIKDLCYLDPKEEITPLVYKYKKEDNVTGMNADSYFSFNYKEGVNWYELERKIGDAMREIRPNATYNLGNLEINYLRFIKSESMLSTLLMIITLVCVIVAVSGLYSIVSLLCQKRRKEIAIRKINGARTTDILNLFIKEYLPIIILSTIAAFSIGTVIMHRWLTTYIRQTPMTVWIYLSVLLCMLIIIGLTVFGNIRRAMTENPADVIKSE